MTDRAFEPATDDPFAPIFGAKNDNKPPAEAPPTSAPASSPLAAAAPTDSEDADNPFAKIMPKAAPPKTSATGAFLHGAERGVVPALGSLPAIGAGAETGAWLFAPLGPIASAVGAVGGGILGGFGAAYVLDNAQNWLISKLPDSVKDALGQDEATQRAEATQHPYAAFMGGIAPYAVTMRPGGIASAALPENATALQRIRAHPATARVFGGGLMGGMELGQEAAQGETPDWTKIAISTGFGLVFNKPTRIGESLTEIGARPARTVLGRPQSVADVSRETSPTPETAAPEPQAVPTETPALARPPGFRPDLFHEPTVAQAGDVKVMGPGITEQVFQGEHLMAPAAEMTAQETARTEQAVMGAPPPLPDVHDVARRMDPDTFARYDELSARQISFREWLNESGPEATPVAQQHLAETERELDEVTPQVAAAYRRAAEVMGSPTVEPMRPTETAVPGTIDNTHDVVSGANSSKDPNGPVYIDKHIPEFSPTLKDGVGQPLNLWKYLTVHEAEEAKDMARWTTEFKEKNGREPTKAETMEYYNTVAHPKVATPAERAAVERDGGNWASYTHEMDGYLDHIEHENPANPPPDQHVDPEKAIDHHKSSNKTAAPSVPAATSESVAPPEQTRTIEQQRDFIVNDVRDGLIRAGRSPEEAHAAAQLIASRFAARSQWFEGRLGTAQEMYEREGAQILRPGERKVTTAPRTAVVGPRASPRETWSIFQELAARGGLKPNGELRTIFGGKNKWVPGFGPLLRENGMPLDRAIEALKESGHVIDPEELARREQSFRDNDLLELIDKEARGQKQYRVGAEPETTIDPDEEQHRIEQHLDDALTQVEVDPKSLSPSIRSRILEIMQKEHVSDPVEAFERAWTEEVQNAADQGHIERTEHIAGWDDDGNLPADATAGPPPSSGPQGVGETVPEETRGAGGLAGASDREAAEALELFQRRQRGLPGQTELPGTAPITDAELAQRKADEALKPSVAQKPTDFGLFGDSKDQKELFSGERGAITLNPSGAPGRDFLGVSDIQPILRFARDANASTFIHETGHQFLAELMRDAEHPLAPDQLKADAKTALDWLKVKSADDIKTRQHEKFARGFEQYVREGVAPSPELASVFAKFKQWLTTIYQTLKGLGQPINDDIRRVFDRMLSAEPQPTVIAPERNRGPSLADIHREDAASVPPSQAGAHADLIEAEGDRYSLEPPKDIADEIAAGTAEVEQALAARAGGSGTEPGAEVGGGASEAGEVVAGGGVAEPLPGGSGVGEGRGAIVPSGGGPEAEGAGVPGREHGRRAEESAGDREPALAASPAPTFGPGDKFNLGKDGNVRVENITSVPDLVKAINDSSERIGGGGPLTMGEMTDLAEDVAMDPAKIDQAHLARVFGGAQNLSSKIWALRVAIRNSAEIVWNAMRKVGETGSDADAAAFAVAMARHDMMQSVLSSVTTETGRALGMGFRNLEGWESAQNLNLFMKQNTGRELFQLKMMAKLGAQLDSPAKVSKFLRDAQKRSYMGMLQEYWINGLISGVATHTTYMVGNLVLSLQKAVPETLAAAAIGQARQAFGRGGERVRAGEALAGPVAMLRGLPAAVQAGMEALKTGQTTLLPGEQARPLMPFSGDTSLAIAKSMTNDPVTWGEVGSQGFALMRSIRDAFIGGAELLKAGGVPGAPLIGAAYSPLGQIPDIAVRGVPVFPVGSAIRAPGRAIAAIHSFFRTMNYLREGAADAYRTALNEGLSGNQFYGRIGDIRQNPTPEQMERWRYGATETTLMGQGGAFTQALGKLINTKVSLPILGEFAPLKFIDPFVHISSNIIKQSIVERTPFGILSSEMRADLMGKNGNIAQDTAQARMLVGTSLSLLFGGLAMEGYASGSGPSDPKEAAMWRLAGNQAHSIRIGDMWYDVHRLGPMGMLMGVAADMYDVAHAASEGEMTEAAAHLQHAFTQNVLDESFMRGPADLIKAVEDPGRYGDAYVRNILASFVPFSVGMAQMARAGDPYSRQARTVMDAIKQKIPGMSETLLPRRDIWGEPMPNKEALGAAGFSAIYQQRMSHDPVNLAMLDLGINPGQVARKIRNIDLTDEEFDDFARIAGRMTKMRLDQIVRSPNWQSWPPHVRHDVIQETMRQSREAARGMMLMKFPHIVRDAVQEKMDHLKDED